MVLRDGSAVLIRPVQSADAPLLADGFARLSAQSRQMRFLTKKKELSPAELRRSRLMIDVGHHRWQLPSPRTQPGVGLPVALCPPFGIRERNGPAGSDRQGLGLGGQAFCCSRTRWRAECLAGS